MNPELIELATRHGALRARIDEQRRQLARHAVPLEAALAKGDAMVDAVDWLKRHPAAVGVAAATFAIAKPKRAWHWAQRGFFVWRGWQAIWNKLAGTR